MLPVWQDESGVGERRTALSRDGKDSIMAVYFRAEPYLALVRPERRCRPLHVVLNRFDERKRLVPKDE
jgi:hypothetical protein